MANEVEESNGISILSPLLPIPRERAFLESFCCTLANFQFDRAREFAEKEKEMFKPEVGSSWSSLLNILMQLAGIEKSYFTMIFVERRLLRRETIKPVYLTLSSEMRKHTLSCNVQTVHGIDALLFDLSKQLQQFIKARIRMIEFYEFVAKSCWNHVQNADVLLNGITSISEQFVKDFHHPVLDPLKTSFTLEVEIVQTLLRLRIQLSEWEFFDSLLLLRDCQTKLHSWFVLSPTTDLKEQSFSYKSFFRPFNKRSQEVPFLYQWLHQYFDQLLAKFFFYFYTTLIAQAPLVEIKQLLQKTSIDFITKITNFQRKTDALSISLVLDTSTKSGIFCGHGYHLKSTIHSKPTGMSSYPSIINIPEAWPKEHWPNVISILNDQGQQLSVIDKIVYFYDLKLQSCYFLIKVDVRMTLVVVYNSKKKDRDSYILSFLMEIRALLNQDKLYHMLKPGQTKTFLK